MSLNSTCPECGAPACNNLDCWEMLNAILSWEWNDPELAAEHFQTVACYNLQHPAKFEAETLTGLQESLSDYIYGGTPPSHIRRQNAAAYGGSKKVLKPQHAWRPVLRKWPQTIADVYANGNPAGAAARVKTWGTSILRKLEVE